MEQKSRRIVVNVNFELDNGDNNGDNNNSL